MVTQRLGVGKDLSLELTIILDESDHDADLNDRYENKLRDPLFNVKTSSYKADSDNEDVVNHIHPPQQCRSGTGGRTYEAF